MRRRLTCGNKDPVLRRLYCSRTFQGAFEAMSQHPHCSVWPCSFLPGQESIFRSPVENEVFCRFCEDHIGSVLEDDLACRKSAHAALHRFGECDQARYFIREDFLRHLVAAHSLRHHDPEAEGRVYFSETCMVVRIPVTRAVPATSLDGVSMAEMPAETVRVPGRNIRAKIRKSLRRLRKKM